MKVLFSIFITIFLYSLQGYSKTSFFLKIEDEKMIPYEGLLTKNKEFNKALVKNKVKVYKQAFPNIKNKWLLGVYRIESDSNINAIDFKDFIGKGLSLVEEAETEKEKEQTGVCENPNDKLVSQTNLDLIKIDSAWKYACNLPILDIAIFDSCFNINQEDITNNVIGAEGLIYYTSRYHGTAVAGVVSAVTDNNIGIAGTGLNTKMFLTTENWATDYKVFLLAQEGYRVINCSWKNSCYYSVCLDSLYKTIRDTYNTVVVFGAGNGDNQCGSRNSYVYPASYPSVLSVTSVAHINERGYNGPWGQADWKDCHEAIIGDSTQTHHHNAAVDICAPGYNVMSTYPDNTYNGVWGTSFAAPQVAAVVNLMASINPCLSANDLINMVKATADASIYDIPENANYIGLLGTGRLDANQAIKAAVESANIYINTALIVNNNRAIESNYSIRANAPITINTGSSLTLKARKDVTLYDELNVNANTDFIIDVDYNNQIDCNNSY